MAKGKGIYNFSKFKKSILKYATAAFFAISSLFPPSALAETIYHRIHRLDFRIPNVMYGKNQKPTANLEVKVDLDKTGERDYNLQASFYAQGWDAKEKQSIDYITIHNSSSRICIAHPKNVYVERPEEKIYAVKFSRSDKEFRGFWEEVLPLEDSPDLNIKFNVLKAVSDVAFSFFGKTAYFITKIGEITSINRKTGKEMFEKLDKENIRISNIPFYPSNFRDMTARTFNIPIYKKESKSEEIKKEDLIYIMLNVGIMREKGPFSVNETYGYLENLLIEVPLK